MKIEWKQLSEFAAFPWGFRFWSVCPFFSIKCVLWDSVLVALVQYVTKNGNHGFLGESWGSVASGIALSGWLVHAVSLEEK